MKRKNRIHSASPRHHKPTKPNRTIYIICEGETEEKYFKGFVDEKRLHAVVKPIKDPKATDPKSLLEYAKKSIETKTIDIKQDIIYFVFDRDDHAHFRNVYHNINQNNKNSYMKSCVSIPCFSLWILLHSQEVFEYFHRDDIEKKVKKIYPWYKKGECRLYKNLKDKTETAIQNAIKLTPTIPSDNNPLPYTEIHKLIIFLEKIVQDREEAKLKNNV